MNREIELLVHSAESLEIQLRGRNIEEPEEAQALLDALSKLMKTAQITIRGQAARTLKLPDFPVGYPWMPRS